MLEKEKPKVITDGQGLLLIQDLKKMFPESDLHVPIQTKDKHSFAMLYRNQGGEFVAKIYSGRNDRFRVKNEVAAVEIARSVGVPTPRVKPLETSFGRVGIITSRATGSGKDYASYSLSDLEATLAIIEATHDVLGNSFGFPAGDLLQGKSDQASFFGNLYLYGLSKFRLDQETFRYWDLVRDLDQSSEFVFSHRDLKPQHTFFDGPDLAGVIDWEHSTFVDPVLDYTILYSNLCVGGRTDLAEVVKENGLEKFGEQRFNLFSGREFLMIATFVTKDEKNQSQVINMAREHLIRGQNRA